MYPLSDLPYALIQPGMKILTPSGQHGVIRTKLPIRNAAGILNPGYAFSWHSGDINTAPAMMPAAECTNIMLDTNETPKSLTFRAEKNKIIASDNTQTYTGETLEDVFRKIAAHYREGTAENAERNVIDSIFHTLYIGQDVRILPPKTPIIFGYDNKRIGFPQDIVGKTGRIIAFDRKTLSQSTTQICVDNKTYCGSHLELVPA